MQKVIHSHFLRSPLYIMGCYALLLLPEFINLCNDRKIISPFWNHIPVCSKQFVFADFLGNSIWSLLLLVFVFETYKLSSGILKIEKIPIKKKAWIQFQMKLVVIAVVSFVIYLLLTYLFNWSTNSFNELNITSVFYRTVFATYFGINGVLLLSSIKNNNNPLSQKIVANGPLGTIFLSLQEIVFFEKIGRNYFVNTVSENFKIPSNLTVLEKKLSKKHFSRVNRSVIVNNAEIKKLFSLGKTRNIFYFLKRVKR